MALPAHLSNPCEFPCRKANCAHAVAKNVETGRHFVTFGHAGFNTRANNGAGYSTESAARKAYDRHNTAKPVLDTYAGGTILRHANGLVSFEGGC